MDAPRARPRWMILVADDEPMVRRVVRVTFEQPEYLVVEAADGDEAWALLQSCQVDVAILDIGMPGRDGFQLTRAIKGDPVLARTWVILITGLERSYPARFARAAGADYYLTKPFSPFELLELVERCLGSSSAAES